MRKWYLLDGRWYVDHTRMYALLGFKRGHHIPPSMEETREIDGVTVHILPSRGGSKHRIFYDCPACDKLVPFGRAQQHVKGRQHKLNCEVIGA